MHPQVKVLGPNTVPKQAKFRKDNRRFEYEEDKKLKALIQQFGEKNWNFIASMMPGRNRRQCKDRWEQHLSPKVNNTPWTEEEEVLLKGLVQKFGNDWIKIARMFEGRPLPQVRNKWRTLQRRIERGIPMKEPDFEKIEKLDVPVKVPEGCIIQGTGTFDCYCPYSENCACMGKRCDVICCC